MSFIMSGVLLLGLVRLVVDADRVKEVADLLVNSACLDEIPDAHLV
jgi:hypothetical protein